MPKGRLDETLPLQAQVPEVPADAHAARGAKAGAQMAGADAERAGDLLEIRVFSLALGDLIDAQDQAGRRRRGDRRLAGKLEPPQAGQEQGQQEHGHVGRPLRFVGFHQFGGQRLQRRCQLERPVAQRRQPLRLGQLKGHEQPGQLLALRLGIVVKLERKDQQAMSGLEPDVLVVHADGHGGPQRADEHEPVVQRAPPPGLVEVRRRLALKAHDVVRQGHIRGRPAEQLVQGLRQPGDQFGQIGWRGVWHIRQKHRHFCYLSVEAPALF